MLLFSTPPNAVKPIKLMEWLCTLITPEGGTILDPFAGSGTTLQAARNKGFNAIGIEQDADYIQLINKRLNEMCHAATSDTTFNHIEQPPLWETT